MTTGTQTTARFVPLGEFSATIEAAELLLFCRDLGGTLIDAAVAAAGRALSVQPRGKSALDAGGAGVGVAVETTDRTLFPVVRNAADGLLPSVRDEVSRLIDAARAGRLAPSDVGGAAVTVCDSVPLTRAVPAEGRGCLLTVRGPQAGSGLVTLSLAVDGSGGGTDVAHTFFATVVRLLRHPYRLLV
jgi:pyruvate/2-oxoglutarate dehydrogenase complex dihydrolipoamide acyltransferase (E2) component